MKPKRLWAEGMAFFRHFLIAVQFFTRIPVTGRLADWVGFSPAMLRASAAHFPGVGWVVGGLTALVFWGLTLALPAQAASAWVAAVVSTAFSVWLTGAFHEDGLADTADGLGGAVSRERALDIMKDSRIGSYGAIALVLALLAKVLLLGLLVQAGGAAGCPGSTCIKPQNTPAVSPPTTQPTPGKCAALARNMAGEKPTQSASRPVTGMRVKN